MLHPAAKLRKSAIERKGLFASHFIPKGTIIWRDSKRDRKRVYTMQEYRKFSPRYKKAIDRFSYPDESGDLVFSLDDDRYMNHSCDANVLDIPGTSMCVAVRDIKKGEEITYDYGLNLREDLKIYCKCGVVNCRKFIKRLRRTSTLYLHLVEKEKEAVKQLGRVKQPLLQ